MSANTFSPGLNLTSGLRGVSVRAAIIPDAPLYELSIETEVFDLPVTLAPDTVPPTVVMHLAAR
jgi:hypothetical protein